MRIADIDMFNRPWFSLVVSILAQINQYLLKSVTWNNSLERLAWRVDVRALSKSTTEQTDEPVAFFELSTSKNSGANNTAKFEMNRTEVQSMLSSLAEIQAVFDGVR